MSQIADRGLGDMLAELERMSPTEREHVLQRLGPAATAALQQLVLDAEATGYSEPLQQLLDSCREDHAPYGITPAVATFLRGIAIVRPSAAAQFRAPAGPGPLALIRRLIGWRDN